MNKFLWGGLVGIIGYIVSTVTMSGILYVVENKLLFEPATVNEVLTFSSTKQLPVWIAMIFLSGLILWKVDLKTTIIVNLMGILFLGVVLGCYLGAVQF
jgi:hypothetical protein